MIEDFASKVEKLYIVEELDPVIEEQVKILGNQVQSAKKSSQFRASTVQICSEKQFLGRKLELDAAGSSTGKTSNPLSGLSTQKRVLMY